MTQDRDGGDDPGLSSEEMIRAAREDVYDDDPLEGYVAPPRRFDDGTGEDPPAATAADAAGATAGTRGSAGAGDPPPPVVPADPFGLGADQGAAVPDGRPAWPADVGAGDDGPVVRRSRWGVLARAVLLVAALVIGVMVVRDLFASGTDVQTLEPGDCFLDFEGTEVSTVETVQCTEAHHFEVFANVELPDGEYPGAAEVDRAGSDGCLAAFPDYVGEAYEASIWYFTTLVPLEDSWPDDRTVNCLLYQPDAESPATPALVTGSGRDSGV